MLYEKKRVFGGGVIDLANALFAMVGATTDSQAVYAGSAISATAATAGYLDYEEANQHFPDESTLEIWGKEAGASTGEAATVAFDLESSEDGETWTKIQSIYLAEADILNERLLYRGTLPGHAGQYLRLKNMVSGEAFTAGQVIALVRPL
jgi:hypothetical protein